MSPALVAIVARYQRILTVIWIAFMAASVVYVVVAAVLAGAAAQYEAGRSVGLPAVVAIATAGLAAAAVGAAIGRRLLGLALRGEAPRRGQGPPPPRGTSQLEEPERYLAGRVPIYQSVMILTWAAYESAAVIGLVLSILARDLVPAVAGSIVALALLGANRPQVDGFLTECDRQRRERGSR